jgi:phage tail sheath protein FI
LIPLDPRSISAGSRTNLLGVSEATLPDARDVPLVQSAETPNPSAPIDDIAASAGPFSLVGGRDGNADATVDHLIGDDLHAWGVAALERVDDVSFVAVPDLMAPSPAAPATTVRRFGDDDVVDAQLAIINSCLRCGDRIAILDLPPEGEDRVLAYRTKLPSGDNMAAAVAAAYHPWIAVADPLRVSGLVRFIPPSGHVAGMIARTDRFRGVHKPPANEVIEGAYDVLGAVAAEVHGRLNAAGINAIRIVPGRGTLVLGARTLSDDVRWRYVNVRRLFSMIEEALDEQMQWAVFEPNNPRLWRHVDRAVRGLLERLYRAGMLDGETSDDAYYIRCDDTTNPTEQTDSGRVTCVIGIQPPYPAEFIVVRIGVTRSGIEIEEKGAQDV